VLFIKKVIFLLDKEYTIVDYTFWCLGTWRQSIPEWRHVVFVTFRSLQRF